MIPGRQRFFHKSKALYEITTIGECHHRGAQDGQLPFQGKYAVSFDNGIEKGLRFFHACCLSEQLRQHGMFGLGQGKWSARCFDSR